MYLGECCIRLFGHIQQELSLQGVELRARDRRTEGRAIQAFRPGLTDGHWFRVTH